jgi:hypothetical protein
MNTLSNPEFLKAVAALIRSLSWPLLTVFLLWLGRDKLSSIIDSLESLTLPGGFEVKLRRAVDREVKQSTEEGTKERFPTDSSKPLRESES